MTRIREEEDYENLVAMKCRDQTLQLHCYRVQARGQKRRIGWFPANYVKLLTASATTSPDLSHVMTSQRPQSAVSLLNVLKV